MPSRDRDRRRAELLRLLAEGDLTPDGQKRLWALLATETPEEHRRSSLATGALNAIVSWSEAYPLEVFHEPDVEEIKRIGQLLRENGMHLDALSASIYRRVLADAKTLALSGLGGGR